MEGPGGYQFVGRTVQMWNRYRRTEDFRDGKQWLLRFFDQIRFYPVGAAELLQMRADFPYGRFRLEVQQTTLRLRDYRRFLADNAASISQFKARQQAAFEAERQRWNDAEAATAPGGPGKTVGVGGSVGTGEAVAAGVPPGEGASPGEGDVAELPADCIAVSSPITGNVWQIAVGAGARVQAGDELIVVEAMKMEIPIAADVPGEIVAVRCERGRTILAGETLLVLRPC
jgi:urea carboxylase